MKNKKTENFHKFKSQKSGGPHVFELTLANGKTKSFEHAYDMWKFATQHSPKMEFKFDNKNGPFLSDYFERLRKK